jgi:hypothetical protein
MINIIKKQLSFYSKAAAIYKNNWRANVPPASYFSMSKH